MTIPVALIILGGIMIAAGLQNTTPILLIKGALTPK